MSDTLDNFNNTTVLVTGATGFTGKVLTRKLVAAGATVKAIARPSSNIEGLQDLDIQWFRGDAFDQEIVNKAIQEVNTIFHLAATFREEKSNDGAFRRVHLHSTQLLAEAATKLKDFRRFVHVSTVGVHGHIAVDRATEEYRFAPGDGYQRTKLEGELWLADYAPKHNLPYTIIRPAPIFGPGDMRLLKIFRMVNKGFVLMLGRGKGMYHLIHVDDLTNIIMLSALSENALSEIFIAAGDEPISIVDMAKLIGATIGKNVRTIRLPLWPFYLVSDLCKWVCTPLGVQPPIYRRRVDFYTKDRQFDNSKVKKLLDYRFGYDNKRGLEETAHWYADHGLLDS